MHHMQSTNAMLHHIMLYMYMNFTDRCLSTFYMLQLILYVGRHAACGAARRDTNLPFFVAFCDFACGFIVRLLPVPPTCNCIG